MKLHEAEKLALEVLKQVMEEKISATNVEVGVVTTRDKQFRLLTKEELEVRLKTLSADPFKQG